MGILHLHFSFIPDSIANIVPFYIAFIFHEHLAVFTLRNQEANLKGQMFKKKKKRLDFSSQPQALLLANYNSTGIPQWISVCVGFFLFFFFTPWGGRVGWQVTGRTKCQHLELQLVE